MERLEAIRLIRWLLHRLGRDDNLKTAMTLYKEYEGRE